MEKLYLDGIDRDILGDPALLLQRRNRRGPRPKTLEQLRKAAPLAKEEFRDTVRRLLNKHRVSLGRWLEELANGVPAVFDADGKVATPGRPGNPDAAIARLTALAEFAAPKLSRAEVTGADGGALTVVIQRLTLQAGGDVVSSPVVEAEAVERPRIDDRAAGGGSPGQATIVPWRGR